MAINVGMIAVVGGFGNLADLELFPHFKVVSHLGRVVTLFKIAVFVDHRLNHSRSLLLSATTRKPRRNPLFFPFLMTIVIGETDIINVLS